MENIEPVDAAAALDASERARVAIARSVEVPRGHDLVMGAAVAVQIATMAIGLFVPDAWARGVLAGGLLVFAVAAGVELLRFRRLNGVRLEAFASRVVLGTDPWASGAYGVSAAAAYVAGSRDLWWLAACLALAGGTAYALSGRRWMRRYREAPERAVRAESTLLVGLLVVVAVAGLVLLVVSAR